MGTKRSWEGTKLGIWVLLLVGLGFALAYRFASPAPPRTIRMVSGEEGGAYALFASRYRGELARHGIELEILYSGGSFENLALLRGGDVDAGLVQAGVIDPEAAPGLLSLGSLFYEPLWVFVRPEIEVELLSQLRGLRLAVGSEDSGTRALTAHVLESNGVSQESAEWLALSGEEGARALAGNRVDVMFVVGSADSPLIRSLLDSDDARLVDLVRAEAYTRLDRTLSRLVLPAGVIDLPRNIPTRDTELLSSVAELVVGPEFHPALVDVLLQAAAAVHAGGDIFAEPGRFPSPHHVDLPLSPDAARYFKYGPPFLQRYMPFWAATQIDRLKVMLIPLVALLLPLIRAFPPTYRWRVRSRIYRWYGELREVDPGAAADLSAEEVAERLAGVARIEREVAKVPTPPSYAEELYTLRLHVDFVRRRLGAIETRTAEDDPRGSRDA